jgi:prepilin-type N-terminal cleavage/methylation domain-containing protein
VVTGTARSRPLRGARSARGFTFIEILMVMALMAILAALGIGLIQNLGSSSRLSQARAIVLETLFACKGSSNGGTHATFVLREADVDGVPTMVVEALAARPVLTADFETLDFVSQSYPVHPSGGVKIDPDQGYVGRSLRVDHSGSLEVGPASAFAMSEGLEVDVRIRPQAGAGEMVIVQGQDPETSGKLYELKLRPVSGSDVYDVSLGVSLVPENDQGRAVGLWQEFTTKAGPVRADGRWTHLVARYDGHDASIVVDGLERLPQTAAPKPAAPALPGAATPTTPTTPEAPGRRIFVPPSGSAKVLISSPSLPFVGWIDAFVLEGMFRSSDFSRPLFRGLKVTGVKLPFRVEYVNGRMDPERHKATETIRLLDAANPGERPWLITLGLDGEITSRADQPPTGGGGGS